MFEQSFGPFRRYRRTVVTIEEADSSRVVEETFDFRLAIIVWAFLFHPLMKRALVDPDRRPQGRWWWPASVIGEQTTRLVSLLSILSVIAGYLGVIIGQTIAFAARDFDVGDDVQSNTLAAVRIGVIVSVVLIRRADLIGRRPLLLGFTFGAIGFTVLGALSPNMVVLGATQAIARGFDTGLLTLLSLAVLEEVPAGVRSLGVGLMGMASGLGAGFVIMVLPVADTSPGGWRWVYAVAAVFLPVPWWVARNLPETRRFVAAEQHHAPGDIDRRIFLLLAFAAFAGAMFFSPPRS
ncbi:MAG: MFS transporter [Acidimicrobiales bacterium]